MARPRKQLTDAEKMRDIETYTHDDKKRTNNPPVGMAQHDKAEEKLKTYQFDPHLDPTLQWAGKAEGMSFQVPTSSIHIHESIKPLNIIARVTKEYSEAETGQIEGQVNLFPAETPAERMRRRRESIEFYQHGVDWTNRMIAGDSLVIMNSLLEKEGMAGQVQMVYIDPPYGIKYGSNFQPFVDKRDVKDKKDEDLSQEPEMIKAFRDTWELGIHSYLTYLRDRLLLARELLADSGSIFLQISVENVHLIRNLCDEIFGGENFVAQIYFRKKTMPLGAKHLEQMGDYIVFYAKNIEDLKYRSIYKPTETQGDPHWNVAEFSDGTRRKLTGAEVNNYTLVGKAFDPCRLVNMSPIGYSADRDFEIDFQGKKLRPASGKCWKTDREGMERLMHSNRLVTFEGGDKLNYLLKLSDYPITSITANWEDTSAPNNMHYVVETALKPIQRCMLMTTDPGDLVLDITCGSGTTAYVAEQWGRPVDHLRHLPCSHHTGEAAADDSHL